MTNMKKLTPEEKQKRKVYKRILKETRKKLKRWAKEWTPFDWSDVVEPMIISLESMQRYYENNFNVVAQDDQGLPTRLEMCNHIIETYYQFIECEDWRLEDDKWIAFMNVLKAYLRYIWD
jgi:hypothetical protein